MRKCPYCDFNSHPAGPGLEEDRYVDALLADLDFELSRLQVDRKVMSVFMGGGTPSLFSPGALARLLEGISARLTLAADAEVTLEANPGTTEYSDFAACLEAGINRLSIGAQSFDNSALGSLGRIHTAEETVRAFLKARRAGFRNINLDLMYGLPEQECEGAMDDLDQAIALGPEHISLYQLTLEPNTVFHRYPPPLPPEDEISRMQETLAWQAAPGRIRAIRSVFPRQGQPAVPAQPELLAFRRLHRDRGRGPRQVYGYGRPGAAAFPEAAPGRLPVPGPAQNMPLPRSGKSGGMTSCSNFS